MSTTVVLLACGKTKLATTTPIPARILYQGSLFKKSLAYALTLAIESEGQIFVLSAKYGLVGLDEHILPYEKTLMRMAPSEIAAWGADVGNRLTFFAQHWEQPIEIVVLAGERYFRPLERYLHRIGVVSRPLEGMGIGVQLRWLTQRI
jgi:hypothetical protein